MKKSRHQVILEIIKNNVVDTQERLQQELSNRGFEVTQATVSRDIKALNIVKALDSEGNYRYTSGITNSNDNLDRNIQIFKKAVISVTAAMNDVVIKCYAGTANAACAAIDIMYSDLFIGTLAGDDTIFVITANNDSAIHFVNKLKEILD